MADALLRICTDELGRARRHMEAVSEDAVLAIHSTRKCLKRARALVKFFRPSLNNQVFADANGTLRDVGRSLSATRDFDVLLQTVEKLRASDDLSVTAERSLRNAVMHSRAAYASSAEANGLSLQIKRIADVSDLLSTCDLTDPKAESHELYTKGMKKVLGDGKKAFEVWREDQGDSEKLHEWRKAIQLHSRHMQLVQAAWPEFCLARRQEARAISELTGFCRDLMLLKDFASAQSMSNATISQIERYIDVHLPQALQLSVFRGERLLFEGKHGLCDRLGTLLELCPFIAASWARAGA